MTSFWQGLIIRNQISLHQGVDMCYKESMLCPICGFNSHEIKDKHHYCNHCEIYIGPVGQAGVPLYKNSIGESFSRKDNLVEGEVIHFNRREMHVFSLNLVRVFIALALTIGVVWLLNYTFNIFRDF